MHDPLAAAARTTLASGSARVRRRRLSARGEVVNQEEGVSDFTARRTRVEFTFGPRMSELVERLDERWPWLSDEPEADDAHILTFAGTAWTSGGVWFRLEDADPNAERRHHGDPVWILEALCHGHAVSTPTDERGELGRRCDFVLDLTRSHAALELPPHRGSRPPRVGGAAWIDEGGRLREVTWRNLTYLRRPRRSAEPPRPPGSQVLELWDFGVPVEIGLPGVPPRRPPGSGLVDWVRTSRELRRRRREYHASTP